LRLRPPKEEAKPKNEVFPLCLRALVATNFCEPVRHRREQKRLTAFSANNLCEAKKRQKNQVKELFNYFQKYIIISFRKIDFGIFYVNDNKYCTHINICDNF
jgi:hypothetical protein